MVMDTLVLEQQIDELVAQLFKAQRRFVPHYPWVFVYVLQKKQEYHGLHLPDTHNKTVHEGIVLAVWEPHTVLVRGREQEKQSALVQGEHVLFPHWSGLPVSGFKEDRYRIVKETDWTHDSGGTFASIETDLDQDDVLEKIVRNGDPDYYKGMVDAIRRRFVLVDKEKPSATLSGV